MSKRSPKGWLYQLLYTKPSYRYERPVSNFSHGQTKESLTQKARRRPTKDDNSSSTHGETSDLTYGRMRDLIVRGRILPGDRIVEADMATRFGVSRTPVREAMSRLLYERFLVPSNNGRRTQLVVAPFTAADVCELWAIIGALEQHAATILAGLPKGQRTIVADDLQRINADLRKAASARPRNPDALFALQSEFHVRFVYEVAGPYLRHIYDALRPQVQRYEWAYGTRLESDYGASNREHAVIIDAVRSGDARAASQSVITHWARAAERTEDVIGSIAERSRALSRRNAR